MLMQLRDSSLSPNAQLRTLNPHVGSALDARAACGLPTQVTQKAPSAIHNGVALGNASASPMGAGSYGAGSPRRTERTGTSTLPVWTSAVSVGAVTRTESGPTRAESAAILRSRPCVRSLKVVDFSSSGSPPARYPKSP